MKKLFVYFVILFLLPILLSYDGYAENAGLTTLGQAVVAARAVNSQSAAIAQANEIALNAAEVIIDLDFANKKCQYLKTRQEELQRKADKADSDFRTGKIDAKARDELKKEATQNQFDLNYYQMQVENGEKEFQSLTGAPVSKDFDFDSAYLITDAGKLVLPPSVGQQDSETLEKKVDEAVADYNKLGKLISAYIDAGEKLSEVQKDFKTGKADSDKLETAGADKEKARIDALEGKKEYSKCLYELDCSLQGYISRNIKQIADPIFLSSQGKG